MTEVSKLIKNLDKVKKERSHRVPEYYNHVASSEINKRKYFSMQSIVNLWNSLPQAVEETIQLALKKGWDKLID